MAPLLYLSVPVSMDMGCVHQLIDNNRAYNVDFDYWIRNTVYNRDCITNSDGIVVFHPENQFEFKMKSLPIGVRKEVREAILQDKPIYMAYRRIYDGAWGIYSTTIESGKDFENITIKGYARQSSFKTLQKQKIEKKLSDLENKVQEMDAQPEIAVSENIILLYGA